MLAVDFWLSTLTFDPDRATAPYMKPCSRTDPKLAECITRNANEAIPLLFNGDKQINFPKLNPLQAPLLELIDSPSMKLKFKDVFIDGFDTITVEQMEPDFVNRKFKVPIHAKEMKLEGTYDINGEILGKHIEGTGPAHLKVVDLQLNFLFGFDFIQKDGKEFAKLRDETMEWSTARNYITLDNLFDGDKELGDEMNKLIEENWKEAGKDILSPLCQKMVKLESDVIHELVNNIPFNEIYDD